MSYFTHVILIDLFKSFILPNVDWQHILKESKDLQVFVFTVKWKDTLVPHYKWSTSQQLHRIDFSC